MRHAAIPMWAEEEMMSIKSEANRKLQISTEKYRSGYDAIDWRKDQDQLVAGERLEGGDLCFEKNGKLFKWRGLFDYLHGDEK